MSRTSGRTASARAMHSRCCWPPESAPPGVAEPVLHLVPEAGPVAGSVSTSSLRVVRDRALMPAELEPGDDVLGDRHRRERVRLLEHHADAAADVGDQQVGAVDVDAVDARPCPPSDAPGTSSCMRLRIRRNVDLPQPDGPISAVTWFALHLERHAVEHLVVAEPRADVLGDEPSAAARPVAVAAAARSVSIVFGDGHARPFRARRTRLNRPMCPGPRPPTIRATTNRTSTRTSSTSAPVHARWIAAGGLREADEPVDEQRQRVLLAVERVRVERRVARAR